MTNYTACSYVGLMIYYRHRDMIMIIFIHKKDITNHGEK